ncbi:MAG: tRNA glutamyl-Q(34) synthetase GluQRS [Gammaproteobacteria bacterium]|nr:MAG: tRNA glutamyl-Q(34) synthetase GluQRS [Gammaproteobacteria bacterium]
MRELSPSRAYRGRFAPSPTGPLHFGSLVAAVGSYLEARRHDGVWLVRVDDIDPPREVPGASQQIIHMLAGYGMVSDEPVLFQSTRQEAYEAALQKLERSGALFPCACSRRDLALLNVYPGTCRNGLPSGKPARSLRVRVTDENLVIDDVVQGEFAQRLDLDAGDFVVRRADGYVAYHLANVVDDAAQGISEVVRGNDLLDSTPRQVHLQKLLGLPTPGYAHLPVVMGTDGKKLSKQTAAAPVNEASRVPTLLAALRFLGQAAPLELNRESFDDLWCWAEENWSLDAVPAAGAVLPGQKE